MTNNIRIIAGAVAFVAVILIAAYAGIVLGREVDTAFVGMLLGGILVFAGIEHTAGLLRERAEGDREYQRALIHERQLAMLHNAPQTAAAGEPIGRVGYGPESPPEPEPGPRRGPRSDFGLDD